MREIALPPQALPVPPDRGGGGLYGWITSLDHKQIGIMYLIATFVFFIVGGVEALLMRTQLAVPNNTFLSPEVYNQLFTMHGTTMIFLVVMPMLIGLATYVVPLQVGARDIAYPRMNALSLWLLVFGGLLLYFSYLAGGAPDAGWFSYAPLSEKPYTTTTGVDYWILGLLATGIGTIAAAINLIVTILALRAPGMRMTRLPLFTWMVLVNSVLILCALPVLNASLVMLLIDRQLNAHFFAPQGGGSAILWQHFFWAFGHPEVYIMVLPAFGIISEVIPVFSRKAIYGYEFVAASTGAIAFLSLAVWAHHMFTVGLGRTADLFFAVASMLIAIPTGVKVLNWCATLWGGAIRFTTAMLFAMGFRALLLVSEDDGANALGGLGQVALLADVPGVQPYVHDPARPGASGDAPPRLHLSRPPGLGPLQHDLHRRSVPPGLLGPGVPLERVREPARRPARRGQPVERLDAGMGDAVAAARAQLRSGAPDPGPATAVGPGAS